MKLSWPGACKPCPLGRNPKGFSIHDCPAFPRLIAWATKTSLSLLSDEKCITSPVFLSCHQLTCSANLAQEAHFSRTSVLKWGLPAPTFLCRKSVWFQSQVFKDEKKLGLREEMELFALKAFLLILVSATVPRSLVPTRESSFHPEKVDTVFPNKPWTIAQTSDFKAFLRLWPPKLKRVMERTENCNGQRAQASGGVRGYPEAFTQSNIALCWGQSCHSTNPLARRILHSHN